MNDIYLYVIAYLLFGYLVARIYVRYDRNPETMQAIAFNVGWLPLLFLTITFILMIGFILFPIVYVIELCIKHNPNIYGIKEIE